MIREHLDDLAVYVVTPYGAFPDFNELKEAKNSILGRMFTAKELCSRERLGKCAVTWNHDIEPPEDLRRGQSINTVDVYSLDCDNTCPLGINDTSSTDDMIKDDD